MSSATTQAAVAALREARAALQRGDAPRAEARCRDALALNGGDPAAWTLLGTILRRNNPIAAQTALAQALQRDPRHVDAHFHLGNLHREQGQHSQAIAAYETALALAPSHPSLLNNLALALQSDGQAERAEEAYRAVLAAKPGHRQALANLAHLLCSLRRYAEAAKLCAQFVRRYPEGDATVWVDWGISQYAAHDLEAAQASFQRALRLAPGDTAALSNLGCVLSDCGEYKLASEILSRAARSDRSLYTLSMLAHCRAHLCHWNGIAELHAAVAARLDEETDESVNAFAALSIPLTPAAQLRVAQRWARDLKPVAPAPVIPLDSKRASSRPRVAYVSSDFRTHAMAWLATEVWELHDRNRIETYAYSIGPRETSPLRARIEAAFDHFADCYDDDAQQTAQRIRSDEIDVLIDLNGYTAHARSEIFALKPAPIQINCIGFPGTLGAPWYDYIFTDRFSLPEPQRRFYTERPLYMPHMAFPSDTTRLPPGPAPSREACGLPAQGFVFCCFNSAYKILPETFAVWMRLLEQVPGSVLWLLESTAEATANLRHEAQRAGIDPGRLIFARQVGVSAHVARNAAADLFVDTYPYGAHTTANDALLAGLPLLTRVGETLVSRIAGSQLHAIGLPELVTESLEAYEALALKLAREPELLRGYRERLAVNRRSYPLFDMARYARDFEAAMLSIWEEYRRQHL